MSHSKSELNALLVIAPVGAFIGRVQTGVDAMVAKEGAPGKTKVEIILVVDNEWSRTEPTYMTEFVEPIKKHVLSIWGTEVLPFQISCEIEPLSFEDEEYLTGWLLQTTCRFLREAPEQSQVFVDLTSAPRPWTLAATSASNFFTNMELYVVESLRKKQFSDYDRDEINDRGIPRPKIVRASRSNLDDWMRPTDERGNPNIQYLLFKTIYHLALSRLKSNEQKRDDPTGVLVFNRDVLRSYHANLPEKLKRRYDYEPHIAKSISRMLTSADTFQMFDRTATTISFTKRGAMLAEALFSDERRTVQNEIQK